MGIWDLVAMPALIRIEIGMLKVKNNQSTRKHTSPSREIGHVVSKKVNQRVRIGTMYFNNKNKEREMIGTYCEGYIFTKDETPVPLAQRFLVR